MQTALKCNINISSCGSNDEDTGYDTDAVTISVKAIDLGLSVKWANCNVGAYYPEQYGGLYGWADPTGTKTSSNNNVYPSSNPPPNTCGTKYDIAREKCGGSWRLPTHTEQTELRTQCSWTWTTYHGINGYKVVGPNGNSIFLPAAGCRNGMDIYSQGLGGFYWSGTLCTCYSSIAYGLYFRHSNVYWYYNDRSYGQSVRPVTE